MFQHVFELYAVDLTCEDVRGSEAPVVFKIII